MISSTTCSFLGHRNASIFQIYKRDNVNSVTLNLFAPLHTAAQNNIAIVLTALVEGGPDIDAMDSKGFTLLQNRSVQ